MKTVVQTIEVEKEGLAAFLGEKITVYCLNYIYTGTLLGINETCIKLSAKDAAIVYETGSLTASTFKDAQLCGRDRYVMIDTIESFEAGR
jgi:hypothetical protein